MVTVTFACGHKLAVSETSADPPICPQCREHRVSHTDAPPPRFSGFCASPLKKD